MENKINIAELLKDCKGMKLYSPLCGECRVFNIYNGLGFDVICEDNTVYNFSYDGRYNIMGECCIFPSKENRDWSTFQRPFKDGDIASTINGKWIGIVKKSIDNACETYIAIHDGGIVYNNNIFSFERFATEEEKQKLFDTIKANGYHWNTETKTLEELVKPKFKVGDRIKYIYFDTKVAKVVKIHDKRYELDNGKFIEFQDENAYEISYDKFDITTLKSFESKVLVRDVDTHNWIGAFYSHYKPNEKKFYIIGDSYYLQCIPYESNKHLLGTTDDCDKYYKTWE